METGERVWEGKRREWYEVDGDDSKTNKRLRQPRLRYKQRRIIVFALRLSKVEE